MAEQSTAKLRRLVRVLLEQPDPQACQRCLDDMEAYCVAQIAGNDAATLLPEVAFHLDTCVACAEVYALLYDTLASPAAATEPARYPTADLGFLPARAAPSRTAPVSSDLQTLLAQAIQRSGRSLHLTFSQGLLQLLPAPAPAQAFALRSPGQPLALFELRVSDPETQIEELLISAIPHAEAQLCDLRVRVTTQGQSWPDLEGIIVQLRQGEQRQQARTDAWGEVVFRNLERAQLGAIELSVEVS